MARQCIDRARVLHSISPDSLRYQAAPMLKVLGDPDEVRAAISNLIDNAVKYSGKDVKVTVEMSQDDGHVLVRVKDEGVEFPKSQLKQVFKRFYRVPSPQMNAVKGTGLGLYILRPLGRQASQGKGLGGE